MERHFDQELAELKDALLRMSALAEQSVGEALKALVQRDSALAEKADAADEAIDHMEMEIDDRVVKLLALRQPAAKDLRFILMSMKIAAELERIGDQAVNIAHRVLKLNEEPQLKPFIDIPQMADLSCRMVHEALDAFVYAKPDQAQQIIARDDNVDKIETQLHRELTSFMLEDPHTITRAMNLIGVAHSLERIADHATNIAEEVVYLYEARDIRHQLART